MTDTVDTLDTGDARSDSSQKPATTPGVASRGGSLQALKLPELREIAGALGIKSSGLRKADLVNAIKGLQGQPDQPPKASARTGDRSGSARGGRGRQDAPQDDAATTSGAATEGVSAESSSVESSSEDRRATSTDRGSESNRDSGAGKQGDQPEGGAQRRGRRQARSNDAQQDKQQDKHQDKQQDNQGGGRSGPQDKQQNGPQNGQQDKQGGRGPQDKQDKQGSAARDAQQSGQQGGQQDGQSNGQPNGQSNGQQDDGDDEDGGSRRSRRRRGRDRQVPRTQGRNEPDTTILDDDVLTPCAGIIDVLENYAFVRTTGYLPGPDDVYVSLSMVRKMGLRRGDAITGQVRQPRDGERREKFNPLVKVDSINGSDPDEGRVRKEFADLTPLYPTDRLRLETTPDNLTGRFIDLAAPLGKGQRGLIVSPAKAGKTMVLKSIAASVAANNPECHLMVVLIDERPEEVTDFERSIKGEVISSTFDRHPTDHTTLVELAIERAKRLVELDHDVVVLLDGITRLGRAYHLTVGSSGHAGQPGRALAGGVDSSALYPPKRFFGAARNIENGGSLTILATALVESGSVVDEVILEEFQGTDNSELRLSRSLADRRLFPAIDLVRSGTRREEDLLAPEELQIIGTLRRALGDLPPEQAYAAVRSRLDATSTNYALLNQVRDTPADTLAKG